MSSERKEFNSTGIPPVLAPWVRAVYPHRWSPLRRYGYSLEHSRVGTFSHHRSVSSSCPRQGTGLMAASTDWDPSFTPPAISIPASSKRAFPSGTAFSNSRRRARGPTPTCDRASSILFFYHPASHGWEGVFCLRFMFVSE